MIATDLVSFALGLATGAVLVGIASMYIGLAANRRIADMEAGMVRLFETRLKIADGRGALEAWRATGYGPARIHGVRTDMLPSLARNGDEIDPDLG